MFLNNNNDYYNEYDYDNANDNGNKVRIETVGETRMKMIDSSGRRNETNANWDLSYNNDAYGRGGLEGDVETLENGKRSKYRLQMDNEDLAKIFSAPQQQGMLNRRLMDDFQMPRRRPLMEPMMIIEEQPQIMDNSLMQIMRALQQQHKTNRHMNPQRSRRMHIDYSSGPRRSHKHRSHRIKHLINPLLKPRTRTRRRRSKGIKRPSSSKRYSLRSNIPLTEIND